jgi:hypothetical protein
MLQADLNARTRAYRERLSAKLSSDSADDAALTREAQELADRQRRLAGLVHEMLSRDNGNGPQQE